METRSGHSIVVIGDERSAGGKRSRTLGVDRQCRDDVLPIVDAALAVVLRGITERMPGLDEIHFDVQGFCRGEKYQRVRVGPVESYFAECGKQCRGERTQQRLVEERHIHPLNEDAVVVQMLAYLLHELERVEV